MNSHALCRGLTWILVVSQLHQLTDGLQCYSCSGEAHCQNIIRNYPHRSGRCRVADGKCFVRRDPNNEVYWGCIDDSFWPRVAWRQHSGCWKDWTHGWTVPGGGRRPIVWCLCARDDCNVDMKSSKPTGRPPPVTTTRPPRTTAYTTAPTRKPTTTPSSTPAKMTRTPSLITTTTESVPASTPARCPRGFQLLVSNSSCSCYLVVSPTSAAASRSYLEAAVACRLYGAHLVAVETVDEQRRLATVLATQPVILQGWQGWWTSGQVLPGINLFVWRSSNRFISPDPRLWGFLRAPLQRTCVWVLSNAHFNYTLANYDCTTRAGYICELELPTN